MNVLPALSLVFIPTSSNNTVDHISDDSSKNH